MTTVPRGIERVRHDPKFRVASVVAGETVTPRMRRLVLHSAEFADFRSDAYDDHIRLYLPKPGQPLVRGQSFLERCTYMMSEAKSASRERSPRTRVM